MGEYSNSSYSAPFEGEDDDQDTSAAKPIEEGVDQSQSDDPTENVGENQVKHAEGTRRTRFVMSRTMGR
jgi:hypothetical protein